MSQAQEEEAKEIIALQVRLLLFQEGCPGSVTVRRAADGQRRVEVEFSGMAGGPASVRGSLQDVALMLVQVGTRFHRMDANHGRKALAAG